MNILKFLYTDVTHKLAVYHSMLHYRNILTVCRLQDLLDSHTMK